MVILQVVQPDREEFICFELNKYEVEQEDWMELTKKTFNFSCYAWYWFEKGNAITKIHTAR